MTQKIGRFFVQHLDRLNLKLFYNYGEWNEVNVQLLAKNQQLLQSEPVGSVTRSGEISSFWATFKFYLVDFCHFQQVFSH